MRAQVRVVAGSLPSRGQGVALPGRAIHNNFKRKANQKGLASRLLLLTEQRQPEHPGTFLQVLRSRKAAWLPAGRGSTDEGDAGRGHMTLP